MRRVKLPGFDLAGVRVWETPEVVSLNRLPMRASTWPAPDQATALASPRDGNEWFHRLDGTWRFAIADRPEAAPVGFESSAFDDQAWAKVAVPGCFTMQGFAAPIYTNVQMPFRPLAPQVPDDNPTGLYRTTFAVPRGWRDRRIVLHLGGAESLALLWINGEAVGLSKDSRLACEFDITRHVRHGRRNTLAIMVIRWSDATYLEDQDQWWHAGIHREVVLYSTASTFIADVHTNANLHDDLATGSFDIRVDVGYADRVRPDAGWTIEVELRQPSGRPVGKVFRDVVPHQPIAYDFDGHRVRFHRDVRNVAKWSHESPTLYGVVISLIDPDGVVREVTALRVGFRRVEVQGKDFLLNGERVLFFGVNRHDFDPDTGRVVTPQQMRSELALMKQFGFNALRTSHAPNDPALLDLCDELGMLVVDEANIESHGLNTSLCHNGRYLDQVIERGRRMVERDKNHPCIVMWSLGNESGYGAQHDALAGWIRHYDPTRPLHYEGAIMMDWNAGHAATDVLCPMYPEIWAVEFAARTADRPVILCEYSHAMGNSNGCLGEYFDAFQQPGAQGGFIWEFWDHGLRQYLNEDGTPLAVTGIPTPHWRFAYGGDFAERRHDANFVCDGVVWPDRTPKPALWEHKFLARPMSADASGTRRGNIALTNRSFIRDSSWLRVRFAVAIDGVVAVRGALPLPPIAPRATATVALPVDWRNVGAGECIVTITYLVAKATPWCDAGFEIGHDQIAVDRGSKNVAMQERSNRATLAPVTRRDSGPRSEFAMGELLATFDRESGLLTGLERDGEAIFVEPPRLALWRAPIDNDGLKLALGSLTPFGRWRTWGLDALTSRCVATRVSRSPDGFTCTATHEYIGSDPDAAITHRQRITLAGDATLSFAEDVRIPDYFADLPRIGIRFDIATSDETLQWYGDGPHECYPDRQRGARLGLHSSTAAEQYVPYVMPQEHGLHTNTRWVSLGHSLRIGASQPFMFSALHHTPEQLTAALHDVELVQNPATTVHIDHRHRGLGTASCGPDTLDKYLVKPGRYRWNWSVCVPPS